MSAFEKLLQDVNELGIQKAGEKIFDSLVRLTAHYKDKILEEITTQAIKGRIFLYVFLRANIRPSLQASYPNKLSKKPLKPLTVEEIMYIQEGGYCALTPTQISKIIGASNEKTKVIIDGCYDKFNIDELWVCPNEVDALLHPEADQNQGHGNDLTLQPQNSHKKPDIDIRESGSKRKTNRRVTFEKFIDFLIDAGYTKKSFRDAITLTYLWGKNTLQDEEKFNQHPIVTNVYTTKDREGKYKLHFSFTNSANDPLPQKPYSLDTVDNIFDEVMKARLNNNKSP